MSGCRPPRVQVTVGQPGLWGWPLGQGAVETLNDGALQNAVGVACTGHDLDEHTEGQIEKTAFQKILS